MDLEVPKVMGILNVTPDSFYAESRSYTEDVIRRRIKQMLSEEVDIIDIGGYSTRPGFDDVSENEEMARIELGCKIVRELSPSIPLSIDTFRATVAEEAICHWKADIINDISGGDDSELLRVVARYKAVYVVTHNRRQNPGYRNLTAEVITELSKEVNELHRLGVNDIIVDPGFGFAKSVEENFQLLNELQELAKMDLPLLVGISRKSLIYKTLGCSPDDSLVGTVALNAIALEKGADIIRVHDVKAALDTVKLFKKLNSL